MLIVFLSMVESGYCLLTCISSAASCWCWRVAVGVFMDGENSFLGCSYTNCLFSK